MALPLKTKKPQTAWSAHLGLLITVTIWASTFINIKIVLPQVPPNTLAFLRFFIASIVLALYFWATHQQLLSKKHLPRAAFTGLTGVALYNLFQNQGLKYASAIDAAILASMSPVFMVILARTILKEKITIRQLYGIVIAFTGSLLVATKGSLGNLILDSTRLWGDALVLCTGLIFAIYNISLKSLLQAYKPVAVLTYTTIFGALILLPFALLEMPDISRIDAFGWANIFYLGLFASALCYFLWNSALTAVPTSAAGSYLYLIPLIAALISALFLEEALTAIVIAGGLLVLVGTYFASQ